MLKTGQHDRANGRCSYSGHVLIRFPPFIGAMSAGGPDLRYISSETGVAKRTQIREEQHQHRYLLFLTLLSPGTITSPCPSNIKISKHHPQYRYQNLSALLTTYAPHRSLPRYVVVPDSHVGLAISFYL
jgi:hypothetical protein